MLRKQNVALLNKIILLRSHQLFNIYISCVLIIQDRTNTLYKISKTICIVSESATNLDYILGIKSISKNSITFCSTERLIPTHSIFRSNILHSYNVCNTKASNLRSIILTKI